MYFQNREVITSVDYDNGFIFKTGTFSSNDGSLEPLSAAQEYNGFVDVPIEVMDNKDAPLKLNISLHNEHYDYDPLDITYKGATTDYICKIR